MAGEPRSVVEFLGNIPSWARSAVFAILTIPISVAATGMILNINLGAYLDQYLAIIIERQKAATTTAATRIIGSLDTRMNTLEELVNEQKQATINQEAWFALISDTVSDHEERITTLEEKLCPDGPCSLAPKEIRK